MISDLSLMTGFFLFDQRGGNGFMFDRDNQIVVN